MVRSVERLASGRAPLEWLALLLSLSAQLVAVVSYASAEAASFLYLPLAISAILAGLILIVKTQTMFLALLGLRMLLFLFVLHVGPFWTGMEISLASSITIQAGIYEPFPANLMLSLGIVVLPEGIRLLGLAQAARAGLDGFRAVVPGVAAYGVCSSLVAVAWSLLIRYRERAIRHQADLARLDRAVGKLAEANLGYQQYASRAEQLSMLEERQRITREIHDVVGYTLTNCIMMMEAATDMVRRDPERVAQLIKSARENAEDGLAEIRDSLRLLRAQGQPQDSLPQIIAKLTKVFEVATGVKVRLELANLPREVSPPVEEFLHHLVQEGLTNSFRHGKATLVKIAFLLEGQKLFVSIWDNGKSDPISEEGIGIVGMRERASKVKARLEVGRVSDGFQVSAEVPIEEGVDERAVHLSAAG